VAGFADAGEVVVAVAAGVAATAVPVVAEAEVFADLL